MHFYDHLFSIFWKPFSLLAKLFLSFRFVQRSRFAPPVLGAVHGSWPERVRDVNELGDLSLLTDEQKELVLRKARRDS